ncbi:serine hydrolase [Anaeroselena agilis]|uniref:Serine hydrolase n=1 Tax=Anaeroselena agilis TaxID=3063788 RepID=A0ABU3P3X4_9FIRM|nr:serine hydrolase [Selenomonadales bacterium 4137-cl]
MLRKAAIVLTALLLTAAAASASPYKEIAGDARIFPGQVGVYAKNLKTGKTLAYNRDTVFPAASTAKLVVALALYKYLYPAANPDKKELYDENVTDMIVISGNDSYRAMLDEIDAVRPDALRRVTRDLRLRKTQVHSEDAYKRYRYHSVTTPYEMALVFEHIYRDRYLGRQKSAELKDKLANTIFRDEIPRFMETPVMHKVGSLDNLLCDVGIVDDGRDQILISIYTLTDKPEEYASDYIARTAAKAYNALRRK